MNKCDVTELQAIGWFILTSVCPSHFWSLVAAVMGGVNVAYGVYIGYRDR